MKIGSLAAARSAFYDRNATSGLADYAGSSIAPHALTTRWTITCAASKKINLEFMRASVKRDTAATTLATVYVVGRVTSGASTGDIVYIMVQDNTLTFRTDQIVPSGVTLYAGESVAAQTLDNCTGGTMSYSISSKYTIFDA